ncbi:MAG: 7-carboxy-7-deazaguanine synthase [Scytonema hyalinum WJT4-NPBG1]|jgi:7-carboxy-7-deazaguanine synthase (Cx14CxxC type)|nr:7-carboxy-7-deazaguanine synthase [Scytonema hyalinum WJT4-NPBG1]
MTYSVKEIFYTLQGEGANAGRPAVFCRFSGCNLWSGREEDRVKAICQFCDTDFIGTDGTGGGKFSSATELAYAIEEQWPIKSSSRRFVVLTGGEPLLQVDDALITALRNMGFTIAVETNGTINPPDGIDWICVSPKSGSNLVVKSGQELKLVFPQNNFEPEHFTTLEFDHFYLQPMDGSNQAMNTNLAIEYCKKHPIWNLSVQTHKVIGIR